FGNSDLNAKSPLGFPRGLGSCVSYLVVALASVAVAINLIASPAKYASASKPILTKPSITTRSKSTRGSCLVWRIIATTPTLYQNTRSLLFSAAYQESTLPASHTCLVYEVPALALSRFSACLRLFSAWRSSFDRRLGTSPPLASIARKSLKVSIGVARTRAPSSKYARPLESRAKPLRPGIMRRSPSPALGARMVGSLIPARDRDGWPFGSFSNAGRAPAVRSTASTSLRNWFRSSSPDLAFTKLKAI